MKQWLGWFFLLGLCLPVWSETPVMPDDATLVNPEAGITAPWIPLFNGNDLTGWVPAGGGKWSVDKGCIVGERGDGRHGWLMTERPYADFFLEFEFKMERAGNSGVQFRSHLIGETMYGYQADILPPGDDRTGQVYEEHGRGWVAETQGPVKLSIELNRWYQYRVSMIDNHLITVIDGVPRIDVIDDQDQCRFGIIALQVHSGDEDIKIRFRNLRIQDYGFGKGWKHLFNGRDLSNWNIQGEEPWIVEDGTILGWNGKKGGNGYLASQDKYTNFWIRARYKIEGKGNSGVFFRSRYKGSDVFGVQSEIDSDPNHNPTGLYESDRRGWIAEPRKPESAILFNPTGWNDIMVYANGPHFRTYLNGFKLIDFVDKDQSHFEGQFGLQVHSGETCKIRFKDVAVLPIR